MWGGQGRRALPCGRHLILTSCLCSSNFPLLVLVQKKFRSSQVRQPWGLPVRTRLASLGPVDNLGSFGESPGGPHTCYGTFSPILPAKARGSHLSFTFKCVAMIPKMTAKLGEKKSLYKSPHPQVVSAGHWQAEPIGISPEASPFLQVSTHTPMVRISSWD